MTQPTVTIVTRDHGPVTVAEPTWCAGHHPDGNLRSEIAHQGPAADILVGTSRGPRRLLELLLWQDPFPAPTYAHGAEVHITARLLDGDHFDYDAAGLDALATDLLEAAGRVRHMARRLAAEFRGGAR